MAQMYSSNNAMPEDRHRLPVGTVLQQRYQIRQVLGQGGFGITYQAWDHLLGEPVAVKEFYPQAIVTRDHALSLDLQCVTQQKQHSFQVSKTRFLREANALQRFRNVRSIVDIRDYFEANNTAYIVMEYLVGRDMKHFVLQRGPLSLEETLHLLEPVFHALTVVHKAGLVHRDISPDNIMLDNQAGAKLLDFGAVRTVEDPSVDSPLSKSTEAILKHGFAPIEQYNTRGSLGPWTDEYALCATIYYCLTGEVPVQPSYRISEKIEPAWDSIPGLTEGQRAALKKGMAIAPGDRFPDVGALYEALYHGAPMVGPVQKDDTVISGPESPGSGKTLKVLLTVLLSLLLAALLGLGGWLVYNAVNEGGGGGGGGHVESGPTERDPDGDPGITPTPPVIVPDPDPGPDPGPVQPPAEDPDAADMSWVENVMVSEPLDILLQSDPKENDIGSYKECRSKVRSVTFLSSLEDVPGNAYRLGKGGTDKVLGWVVWSGGYVDIYIAADGGVNGSEACRNLFAGCISLTAIDFGGAFHTDGCQDMKWMFYGCSELKTLDVTFFDTSRVTMMQAMFRECADLTELDLSSFDTSRVQNMAQMFSSCSELEYIDLSHFDTSSLENMSYMFSACKYLRSVEIGSFDTSRVTDMEGVFNYCGELEDLTLSWDVSSVKKYAGFMVDGKTINGRPWREYFQ